MACNFTLKSKYLSDASSGGEWELVGYSLNESGPYGSGGSWPWSTNSDENPLIDTSNIAQGFYKLNYFVAGICGGIQEVIVPIVGGGDAGMTLTIDTCTTGAIIDIFSELGASFDGGILEPLFSYSGSGVTSSGYIDNNVNTPIDDQFDPSLVGAGSYLITLSITPVSPSGYQLDNCCPPTTASVIINVSEAGLQISLDTNCTIVLDSQIGCDSATFELWKDTGSGFVATGISDLPYQTQEDADWKLVGTGCDCGTIDSNIINSNGCCSNTPLTMYFDSDFCAFFIIGSLGCSGGTLKWFRSCDGGETWEDQPQHNGQSFIFVNDDCCWQARKECPNGCNNWSNIDCASGCAGGCNGALGGSNLPCVYRVASGTYCNGGTLNLIKQGTGVVQSVVLNGSNPYPIDFPITSDGTYYASLDCNDGCPAYQGPTYTYTGCGSSPSCDSILSTSQVGCTITASVTNCPSPVYSFIRPNGTVAYSGANNSYTVDVDGTWQIEASGCPDCPTLTSSEVMSSCEGSTCNCSANLVHNPCGNLVVNPQSCSDYVITWQFRANAGNAWSNIQTGGLTYTATQNGQFRVRFTKAGCPTEYSDIETVTCFGNDCGCSFSITVDDNNCEINWTTSGCSGYTVFMQFLSNGVWTDISTNPSSPFSPSSNGVYRLKATKSGCPTIYSNNVSVNCIGGGCQVQITAMNVDPQNCSNIIVAWAGADGDDVSVIFRKALVNPNGSCTGAGGWQILNGSQNTVANPDGTGFSNILIGPDDCDTCISAIVDAQNEGCGIAEGFTYAPCCCNDTPSIEENGVNETHVMKWINPDVATTSSDNQNKIVAGSTDYLWKRQLRKVVTKNGSIVENTLTSTDDHEVWFVSSSRTANLDYLNGIEVKNQTNVVTYINLDPNTSPYLSGPYGNISQADLYLANVTPAQFISNTLIHIKNALKEELNIDYNNQYKIEAQVGQSLNQAGVIFYSVAKRNDPTWVDLYRMQYDMISGADVIDTTEAYQDDGNSSMGIIYEAPCDTLTNNFDPDEGFIIWANNNQGRYLSFNNTPGTSSEILNHLSPSDQVVSKSVICAVHQLEVINECSGATYLWSTGETTESITVPDGTYSVIVTCPDGCEYTLNITV